MGLKVGYCCSFSDILELLLSSSLEFLENRKWEQCRGCVHSEDI